MPIPVYALGGMSAERVRLVMTPPFGQGRAPAGVATIGAILSATDTRAATRDLVMALDSPA